MIKKIIYSYLFLISLCAQNNDSLFWFDLNKIKEKPPKFPIVINKVLTGDHIFILDSIKQLKSDINEGFRIQIFESAVASIARAEAKRFQNILGDTIYIDFETPLYKLRFGNFINRKNAEKTINKISRLGAQDSWIIRTKIDMDK
tara:strand:+ start:505 stop:939 length:435 start_codon:yes stop_codon:yes gene_type:complete